MSVFTPNLYLNNVTDITPELLQKYQLKALVLDVDNTLTFHNSQEVHQSVLDWLEQMKEHQIGLTIVSNNFEERVRPFAQKLGLNHVSFGCKPMTRGFTRAYKDFGIPKKQIAVVGDQIYTDILGGNLKGMFTILTVPFQIENTTLFKLKRNLEQLHIRKYQRIHQKKS